MAGWCSGDDRLTASDHGWSRVVGQHACPLVFGSTYRLFLTRICLPYIWTIKTPPFPSPSSTLPSKPSFLPSRVCTLACRQYTTLACRQYTVVTAVLQWLGEQLAVQCSDRCLYMHHRTCTLPLVCSMPYLLPSLALFPHGDG